MSLRISSHDQSGFEANAQVTTLRRDEAASVWHHLSESKHLEGGEA
jgi:hypothetical protein